MDDVLVVGGSVAGCAISVELAARGLGVRLVEKGQFPREKVCGEGVMPNGTDALRKLGVVDALMERGARAMHGVAYHHNGKSAVGHFANGRTGLCVRRLALDQVLAARAEQAGVNRQEGAEVHSAVHDGQGWRVTTSAGELRARFLVGADGARSKVRRWLGLDAAGEAHAGGVLRYGVRQHFKLARPVVDNLVHVHLLGRAELYLTPSADGCLNVALLVDRRGMARMKGDLEGGYRSFINQDPLVCRLLEGATVTSEIKACGPLRISPRDVISHAALLVGDAAGYVDAITGEGITTALHTASMAADVIERALKTGELHAPALRSYALARAEAVRNHERMTEVLLFTSRHPWLLKGMVRGLSRRPDIFTRLLGANDGDENVARALLASAPGFLMGMVSSRQPAT